MARAIHIACPSVDFSLPVPREEFEALVAFRLCVRGLVHVRTEADRGGCDESHKFLRVDRTALRRRVG